MARTKQKCRRNNQNVSDNHGEGSSTGARPGFTMEEYNRRIQEQQIIDLNNQNEENRVASYNRAYVEENRPKNTTAACT
ncbi:hypothetical protein [Parasitella parasitica]|uniref:Uncharacterized protein n=1 Tax=Parasitella parasitica TaxID=35722 RepID=A0A0B7N7W0_9FUNG|nr:hypothetical protein [Parasitella parasitica]